MSSAYKFFGRIKTESKFMYLQCEPELARHYRQLAAMNHIILVPQRIDSHISVIRSEELSPEQILPKTFDDELVEVFGNPEYIQNNDHHYWFRIISPRLEDIRLSLGFSNQPVEFVNGKFITHPFHFTFGVVKGYNKKGYNNDFIL